MEPKAILSGVDNLPISRLGEIAEDNEIWETTDGDATIKVTRHFLPIPNSSVVEIIALTVSGPSDERTRVINEFAETFGPVASSDASPELLDHIDTALWVVNVD